MKKSFFLIICLLSILVSVAQVRDSTSGIVDSSIISSLPAAPPMVTGIISQILIGNAYLNSNDPAQPYTLRKRNPVEQNDIFYALVSLIFLLALSKRFFPRYFSNMFRVFFNSSLRQSQLTDQLMQEKIPSLFYNGFFILAVAFYLSLLVGKYYFKVNDFDWHVFFVAGLCLVSIYVVKLLSLRFIGWISGYTQEAEIYIFIIFLINKIMGICLVPIIVIMAFTEISFFNIAMLLSFILIGLMLLMRFLRSYGLLQNRLNVNRFHFLLYIVAMELLPIALIYKAGMMFITKIL